MREKYTIGLVQALQILGLESGASSKQVKKAYRRKAVQCHPDKGGSKQDFVLVKQAYDYLTEFGTKERQPVSDGYSIDGIGTPFAGVSMKVSYVRAY